MKGARERGGCQRSCLIELIEFVFYSRPHALDKKSLFCERERRGLGALMMRGGPSVSEKRKYVLNGLCALLLP